MQLASCAICRLAPCDDNVLQLGCLRTDGSSCTNQPKADDTSADAAWPAQKKRNQLLNSRLVLSNYYKTNTGRTQLRLPETNMGAVFPDCNRINKPASRTISNTTGPALIKNSIGMLTCQCRYAKGVGSKCKDHRKISLPVSIFRMCVMCCFSAN